MALPGWDCRAADEQFVANSFYLLNEDGNAEGGMEMTDYPATSTVQTGIYMSGFNDDDKSTGINSVETSERNKDKPSSGSKGVGVATAPNNPALDPIGAQMHRLTQLISGLRATSAAVDKIETPLPFPMGYSALGKPAFHPSFPFNGETPHSPVHKLNLKVPEQIYKITAQLISQMPYQTNPDLARPLTKHITNPLTTIPKTKYHPDKVVSDLYRKYLTNSAFFKGGEFIKINLNTNNRPDPVINQKNEFSHENPQKMCHIGDRLPNPDDCTKYHICKRSDSYSLLTFYCPANKVFNKVKRICESSEFHKCSNVNTAPVQKRAERGR